MRTVWRIVLLVAVGSYAVPVAYGDETLCERIAIRGTVSPGFSENEKKLVCGDRSNTDGKSEGWSHIPDNQAIYNLKNFLQSRGYLNASVEQTAKGIEVRPGELVRATAVAGEMHAAVSTDFVPEIDFRKHRGVIGQPLTPKLLTSLETWTRSKLERLGYPCADVRAQGGAADGRIIVNVDLKQRVIVSSVRVDGTKSLNPEVLRRYDAFELGRPYDSQLLAISADRAVTDGVVERAFFVAQCSQDPRVALEEVIEGKPRIVSLGVGINTEEVSVLRAEWHHTRIGANASSANLLGEASFKQQRISPFIDWRAFSPSSKSFIRPLVEVAHENEDPYEVYYERGLLGFGTELDFANNAVTVVVGPQVESFQNRQGFGANRPHAVALHSEIQLVSHELEFNRSSIGGGYRLRLESDSTANEFLGSTFGANRFRVRAQLAFNPTGHDPAFMTILTRAGYSVSLVDGAQGNRLPPNYMNYLGGIADLRGFGRMELAGSGPSAAVRTATAAGVAGSLASAYAGLEARHSIIANTLDVGAFADIGGLSRAAYALSAPYFWSPGLSALYKSPIGPFQLSIAHGFLIGTNTANYSDASHWQFYASFGEPL